MQFANELLYVVAYTVLGKREQGYEVQIEVLNAMQKATDLFSRVTADLNQASKKLVPTCVKDPMYKNRYDEVSTSICICHLSTSNAPLSCFARPP